MSSYTKSTDFASKDALLTGNPLKVVKGTELDDEFNSIQTAVNSKADTNSPALTGTPTAPTASAATNTTQIATTAFVTSAVTAAERTNDELIDAIYPVGSIYISTSSTNPGTTFNRGTWEAFATGRTLVGIDTSQSEFNTVEETGGAKTHTLTINEIPAHTHGITSGGSLNQYGTTNHGANLSDRTNTSQSAGGGQAHNNLQPYIVTYMWKRTA
jgi:hypothetical protein